METLNGENNIGRALDAVARDSGRYYVLGYEPSNTNFDGKYRPIQVRVKRDGVRVRARRRPRVRHRRPRPAPWKVTP